MDIGGKLRGYRRQQHYTLTQLSTKVGMSPSYLSEIEQGKKKPSVKAILRICEALGLDPAAVLPAEPEGLHNTDLPLGQKLKAARIHRGWSLHEVSKRAGISPAYLSQIERSQVNPSINVLKRLAEVLQVSLPVVMNRTSPLEIGERIKNGRISLGISRKELAGKAGVSVSLVTQIEQGKSGASLDTIERLATALGVSPCSLIMDSTDDKSEVLVNLSPECQVLLAEPRIQSILRMVCDLSEREFRFILNMIQMLKQLNIPEQD